METFFSIFTIFVILITLLMLIPMFKGPDIYNRFVGVMVLGTNIVLILLLIGFTDGRQDMYVDIAISYGVLSFVSSVILAKFLGGKRR